MPFKLAKELLKEILSFGTDMGDYYVFTEEELKEMAEYLTIK